MAQPLIEAEALAGEGWRALALDLRGHGDSDWSDNGEYDTEHFAADIHCVVEQLGAAPAVVGASLGGMTALTAQRLSDALLFSAVVLVDITPQMERAGVERIVGFMLAHPDGFASLDEASDAIAAYRPGKARPADPSGLARTLRRGDDGRWHWRWDARFLTTKFRATEDGIEVLDARREHMQERLLAGARRLTVPTLLVRGGLSGRGCSSVHPGSDPPRTSCRRGQEAPASREARRPARVVALTSLPLGPTSTRRFSR